MNGAEPGEGIRGGPDSVGELTDTQLCSVPHEASPGCFPGPPVIAGNRRDALIVLLRSTGCWPGLPDRGGRGRAHRGDLSHGDSFRVPACRDALRHHAPGDDPLKLAIFPAHWQRRYPEFAHPVARPPQGLPHPEVRHIRFRHLSRTGHRDPPPLFPPSRRPAPVPCPAGPLRMVVPGPARRTGPKVLLYKPSTRTYGPLARISPPAEDGTSSADSPVRSAIGRSLMAVSTPL